jgi:hypothetical protein
MPLDTSCYIDFIKPEYRNQKIGANIPSEYLLEPFEKILKITRKYFNCEGRFDKVHQDIDSFHRDKSLKITFLLVSKPGKDGRQCPS